MLQENLIKIYEASFRENREMPALTDYFKDEEFSYYEMAKEIAKLHLLFKKAGIKQGDKIALIGRNNPAGASPTSALSPTERSSCPSCRTSRPTTSSTSSTTRRAACFS